MARGQRTRAEDPASPWSIALDGGTTNTRARLLNEGRVVASAVRSVGVRDAVLGDPAGTPLERAARECVEEVRAPIPGGRPARIVAAGMLTSEVGLCPVPHVEAPAGLDALANGALERRVPAVADRPIVFVPGVRTLPGDGPDGWADADVMRGEECETLGALAVLRPDGPAAFLWPGSHTKLVAVSGDGMLIRSHTTLAGELLDAVARHTLLKASLPGSLPEEPDPEAFDAGARFVAREGLARAAFLVRIAEQLRHLDPPRRAAFWIGAVVAEDTARLARHPILAVDIPLWVGGRRPLCGLYASMLSARRRGGPVEALSDDLSGQASALGALAVARRREGRGPESETG